MSWIDLVIAVLVVAAAVHGVRLGALVQLGSFVGFWLGLATGAGLALLIARPLASGTGRTLLTVGLVLGIAAGAGLLGRILGRWAAVAMRRWHLGGVDAAAGAALGAVAVLLSAWLVAGFVLQADLPWVTASVDRSAILRAVDRALPPVPAALSEVQGLLSSTGFPSVFAGAIPLPVTGSAPPSSAAANALGDPVRASVVKVLGAACGGYQEGTAFVVGRHLVLTNAHVVAGMAHPTLVGQGQATVTPVLVDPRLDVAVLRTDAALGPVLHLAAGLQAPGTQAAFVGYPGDGPEVVGAARITATFEAVGRDIYSSSLTTRQVVEIAGSVRPGSSGSPLLVAGGVAGVVFSRSTISNGVGYALSAAAIAPSIAAARQRHAAVATGACVGG